jgi:hypothetical protein
LNLCYERFPVAARKKRKSRNKGANGAKKRGFFCASSRESANYATLSPPCDRNAPREAEFRAGRFASQAALRYHQPLSSFLSDGLNF